MKHNKTQIYFHLRSNMKNLTIKCFWLEKAEELGEIEGH